MMQRWARLRQSPMKQSPRKSFLGSILRDTPASFVAGSPLREDTETIIRRKLTEEEEKKGFELNTLVGMKCRVVVYHKASAGGRPKPAVSIVMPAEAS